MVVVGSGRVGDGLVRMGKEEAVQLGGEGHAHICLKDGERLPQGRSFRSTRGCVILRSDWPDPARTFR